jgi:putative ABC transport system permease protein
VGRSRRNASGVLLLILQIALTVVLVTGATLLTRSFVRLLTTDLGFQPDHVLTFRTNLDKTRYPQAHQLIAYQTELLNRIQGIPGVVSAGASNTLPLIGTSTYTIVQVSGSSDSDGFQEPVAVRAVSADYFRTLGIPIIHGRSFSDGDSPGSARVALVNESLASRAWALQDPSGESIQFLGENFGQVSFTITGVVGDVKHSRIDAPSQLEVYVPFVQMPEKAATVYGRSVHFSVRTTADPRDMVALVRSVAGSVDKDQPIFGIRPMEYLYSESVAPPRFRAILFGILAALALILAVVGVYGLMSHWVAQRLKEIGIRSAVGAQANDVLRMVIRQGLTVAVFGTTIGVAGAFALTRYLSSFLYDISPTDARTYLAVSLLVICVALVACYLPARRATKVDPVAILRLE